MFPRNGQDPETSRLEEGQGGAPANISVCMCVDVCDNPRQPQITETPQTANYLPFDTCLSLAKETTSHSEPAPATAAPRVSESRTSDRCTLPRRSGSRESQSTRTSSSLRMGTPCRSSAFRSSRRLISCKVIHRHTANSKSKVVEPAGKHVRRKNPAGPSAYT